MKNKNIKKSIKLIIVSCLVFTMVWDNNLYSIHADNLAAAPNISKPDIPAVQWDQYAKIAMGGKIHMAFAKNGNLLGDSIAGSDSDISSGAAQNVARSQADAVAAGYAKQSNFSLQEQKIMTSKLPLKDELKPSFNPGASTLNTPIPQLGRWWWTGDLAVPPAGGKPGSPSILQDTDEITNPIPDHPKEHQRKVLFANAVSPQNDTMANYSQGGTYRCVLPNQPIGSYTYTDGGCTKAVYPGMVPLKNYDYDGGRSNDLYNFPGFTGQNLLLKAKESYTRTAYGDTNTVYRRSSGDVKRGSDGQYNAGDTAIKDFSAYIEFDYPTKAPCIQSTQHSWECNVPGKEIFDSGKLVEAVPIRYDTLQPVKIGDNIPANTPLILIEALRDLNSPDWQPKYQLNATYVKFSSDMYAQSVGYSTDKIHFNAVNGIQRSVSHDALVNNTNTKLPGVTAPQVAVRPEVTLNAADIAFFKSAGSGQNSAVGKALNTDVIFTAPAGSNQSDVYKPTIKDSTQTITNIDINKSESENRADVLQADIDNTNKKATIYVKQSTTSTNLNLHVGAAFAKDSNTTSYITALGRNIYTNKTVLGRLAKGNVNASDPTAVTVDLSNLLNTGVLGSKATFNLYTEALSDANKADTISEPYQITVVIAQNQTIAFDDVTQALDGTDVTYGDDDITIKASIVNDLSQPWDTSTPIDVSIDTTDPGDADTAEVVSTSSESGNKFITAKIHLKDGVGGTDGKIKIDINKPASADGGFLAAAQKQITLNVHKRAITITPTLNTMHVDDSYPPAAWPFKSSLTSDPMGTGLVNKDQLPYNFTTVMINPDISLGVASPPLTDRNTLKDTALDKKWGINLTEKSQTDMEAFEKKYIPTIYDYQSGNKKSILQVKRVFDPITAKDISEQPQYAELRPNEKEAVFSTTFTYPLKDAKGLSMASDTTTAAQYQDLDFQWYRKDAGGKVEPIDPGTIGSTIVTTSMTQLDNKSEDQGQMQFTLTLHGVQNADNLTSYYCEVWNDMNVSTPTRTDEAQLTLIQDPVSYVEVPQKIEITNQDKTAGVIKKGSAVQLRTLNNSTEAAPKGAFDIQTDPEVSLYLHGDTTITDFSKIYTMKVLKADGTQVGSDKLLAKLSYPTSKTGAFTLKNAQTDKKEWGTYSGLMTFTITYNPQGSISP